MKRGDSTDSLLTLIFMLLAIAAVICYFVLPTNRTPFLVCGGVAIVLRIVQYVMRFIK
jgi:Ca2+/Na+ antiporter